MTKALNNVTFEEIRQELLRKEKEYGSQYPSLLLLELIERKVHSSGDFARIVTEWLIGAESTVYLRDEICAPFKNNLAIIEAGEIFNPSTEWANTWIPLDTAIHNVRRAHRNVTSETHYANNPLYGMF